MPAPANPSNHPEGPTSRGPSAFLETIMADYHTSFSVLLPVGPGKVDAALDLYAELRDELDANNEAIGFEAEKNDPDDGTVWLSDNSGSGDPEHVIAYALRCAEAFSLSGLWGFHFGLWCSRPRLDGFGGGAHVLDLGRRESVDWLDTGHWLAGQLGRGDARAVPAETILQPVSVAQGWNRDSEKSVLLGFIDSLIAADTGLAERLRTHLAEVSAADKALVCRECGTPIFIADSGTSHHVGPGLDGIDYNLDIDHTALADEEP